MNKVGWFMAWVDSDNQTLDCGMLEPALHGKELHPSNLDHLLIARWVGLL